MADSDLEKRRARIEAWKKKRQLHKVAESNSTSRPPEKKQKVIAPSSPRNLKYALSANVDANKSLSSRKPVGSIFGFGDNDSDDDEELESAHTRGLIDAGKAATDISTDVNKLLTLNETEDTLDALDAYMANLGGSVKDGATHHASEEDDDNHVEFNEDITDVPSHVQSNDEDVLTPSQLMAQLAKKRKQKEIAQVDHSAIEYEPFRKNFYSEASEISNMSEDQVEMLRTQLDGIRIRGMNPVRPAVRWPQFGLQAPVMRVIEGLGYEKPTPIQAQAIPAILSGRDVIAVAKTGSGKTMAFLLPMLRHIKDQRPISSGEGPIALIMSPTRELATQIYKECKYFTKALGLRALCAYGGPPISGNIAELKRGVEIVVCTPGRMIDLLTVNSGRATNLKRVTYLILDEADRMFDLGFGPQVTKIVSNIRPDRQTVLFSATFPKSMETLAKKILTKPLEIVVGGRSVVGKEIEQTVEVIEERNKFVELLKLLGEFFVQSPNGRVLVFVDRQEGADYLTTDLVQNGYVSQSIHGGKDQADRDSVISEFKKGKLKLLVATSVAARGLDVPLLQLVINYDAPSHLEDYVHRAGRTGRAGNVGKCVTFVTPEQGRHATELVKALTLSKAEVPNDLQALSTSFLQSKVSNQDQQGQKFSGGGFGGHGLGKLAQIRQQAKKNEAKAFGNDFETGVVDQPDKEELDSASAMTASIDSAPKIEKYAEHIAKKNLFYTTMEINDFPREARFAVSNQAMFQSLFSMFGVFVTARGVFHESDKNPDMYKGEPKLYLLMEGPSEEALTEAWSEIRRKLMTGIQTSIDNTNESTGGRYTL